ncbi:ATP-binding cassette domain-containing protein [Dactylosporangium sp. NPDC049525]|uniref:ATP-binding cassette domain-containing protein n=1 Tax=Dactylosporangium sp. NPDC049525 TaxID=3154730 RepID=UPI0034341435
MTYAIEAEGLVKRYGGRVALSGVDLRVRTGQVIGVLGPGAAGKTTLVRILATLVRPDLGRARVAGHDVTKEPARVRSLIGRRAVRHGTGPRILVLDEPTAGLDPAGRDEVWAAVRELAADGGTVLLTTRHPEEADQLADRISVIDGGRVVAEGRPGELRSRVGGQILHVRPAVPADTAPVSRILAELTGVAPARDPGTGLLTVPAADPMLLSALVRRLDAAGVTADELGLRRPTLAEILAALVPPGSG